MCILVHRCRPSSFEFVAALMLHPRNQTSCYIGTADSEWVDQFQQIGSEGGQDFQVVREF